MVDHRQMRIGPSLELTAHLIQAVNAGVGVGVGVGIGIGIGIGLVPRGLVEQELTRGELACIGEGIPGRRSDHLVHPPANESLPLLVAFRDWLLACCQGC